MAGKTKHFHGWVLIHTITGWYADNGSERMRVGSSREEHTEALDARWRAAVKERLEMAKTAKAMDSAELAEADPSDEPCEDYRRK